MMYKSPLCLACAQATSHAPHGRSRRCSWRTQCRACVSAWVVVAAGCVYASTGAAEGADAQCPRTTLQPSAAFTAGKHGGFDCCDANVLVDVIKHSCSPSHAQVHVSAPGREEAPQSGQHSSNGQHPAGSNGQQPAGSNGQQTADSSGQQQGPEVLLELQTMKQQVCNGTGRIEGMAGAAEQLQACCCCFLFF